MTGVSSNRYSGRILIIHTDGNTFNNPSLKCIIDLLLAHGFRIDLRYPRTFAPMPRVKNVRMLPYGKVIRRLKRILFDRWCSGPLMRLSVWIEKILYYRDYNLIVGVDRQGLLEGDILARLTGVPLVYISFEITFASETSAAFKALEKQASQNLACWIVQDEERAEQLQRENGLGDANRMLLPLASAGMGHSSSKRLRDELGIPTGKKVAIVIGSVSTWSMTSEIIRSLPGWPDDWVLILHERYGRTREKLARELDELQDLLGYKLFISDSASERVDDMAEILSGIDAGLGFYRPVFDAGILLGNNLKYLGLASGKISTYLRYRVPVVANQIGLYAKEIRAHGLGVIVDGPEGIAAALEKLSGQDLGDNIENYFRRKLDFDVYADDVLSMLAAAARP